MRADRRQDRLMPLRADNSARSRGLTRQRADTNGICRNSSPDHPTPGARRHLGAQEAQAQTMRRIVTDPPA
jgi:hypothetical protein